MDIKINGKWPLRLPESAGNEWIGNMKWHGEWEGPRLDKLHQLITQTWQPGKGDHPIVMYIGAYKGDMAALLQTWGAQMMLVEATAGFWPEIKETWELNELDLPLACFSGLISRVTNPEDTKVYMDGWPERSEPFVEGTTGFAHLAESGGYFPEMSIDDMIRATGIVPDIITMDIEGSEAEACYGAMDTIINKRPIFLLSVHPEFMFHNHNMYERELHDLLRNNKYIGTWLDYDHEHHWLYVPEEKV